MWLFAKCCDIYVWSDIDHFNEGTFSHSILDSLNLNLCNKTTRIKFWFGAFYDHLATLKSTASNALKIDVSEVMLKHK